MKNTRLFSICLIVVLMLSSLNLMIDLSDQVNAESLAGATLYVGPTSTYKTIQKAIDNASSGDTIIVENGTYIESILVNKTNITLKGNSSTDCKIMNSYTGTHIFNDYAAAINVTSFGVQIEGFNITVSGNYTFGIRLQSPFSSNATIINNNITTFGYAGHCIIAYQSFNNSIFNNNIQAHGEYGDGIYLRENSNNNVTNNTIYTTKNSSVGIYIESSNNEFKDNFINKTGTLFGNSIRLRPNSNNNLFFNNTIISASQGGYAINLEQASNNNFTENKIYTTKASGYGFNLNFQSSFNIMDSNEIYSTGLSGYGFYIQGNSRKNEINGNYINTTGDNSDGFYLTGVNNNNITDNDIETSGANVNGLSIQSSQYNRIKNNNLSWNSDRGIHLVSSQNNYISENNVSNNSAEGIYVSSGDYNDIVGNIVSGNSVRGIYLVTSDGNNITHNIVLHNTRTGIYLNNNDNFNYIAYNNASFNTWDGIGLESGMKNNTISNNEIHGNLHSGIILYDTTFQTVENNVISVPVSGYDCLRVSFSTNCSIRNNTLIHTDTWGIGVKVQLTAINTTIINNTIKTTSQNSNGIQVEDKSNSTYIEQSDISVSGTDAYGIYVDQSTATVKDSSVNSTNSFDINVINDGNVTTINSTFYDLNVTQGIGGALFVRNYLSIQALFNDSITPIPNADVEVLEDSSTIYSSPGYGGSDIQTNANGKLNNIETLDRWYKYDNTPNDIDNNVKVKKAVNLTWEEHRFNIDMNNSHTEVFVSTDIRAPPRPQGLKVTRVGTTNTLNISWDLNIDTYNYTVYYDLGSCSWTYLANITHPLNWTLHQNLEDKTTYFYQIQAWDKAGIPSDLSKIVIFELLDITPPQIPVNLSAEPIANDDALNITWSLNQFDTINYDLWWQEPNSRAWVQLGNFSDPENYYILRDDRLIDGNSYHFKLGAWDSVGLFSGNSTEVVAVHQDYLAPTAPKNLTAVASSETNIDLSWDKNPELDVNGYDIWINQEGYGSGGPYIQAGEVVGAEQSYKFTDLKENTTYYFVIQAYDEANNTSPISSETSETTIAVPPSIPLLNNIPNYTNEEYLDITGTADNNSFVIIFNNNESIGISNVSENGSFSLPIKLKKDSNEIKARARDFSLVLSDFSEQQVVIFDNEAPIANAGHNKEIFVNDLVQFNASMSSDNYKIENFTWNFVVNNDISVVLYGQLTSYKFELPGSYDVTLSITDLAGNMDTDLIIINVTSIGEKPIINSTSLINDSVDVAIDVKISIEFSIPMEITSVEEELTILPKTNFTTQWTDNNRILVLQFSDNLTHKTKYTLIIDSCRATTGGTLVDAPFKLEFTTISQESTSPTFTITNPSVDNIFAPGEHITVSGTSINASPGTQIIVTIGNDSKIGTITEDGSWTVIISAPDEEGSYTLKISLGDHVKTLPFIIKKSSEPTNGDEDDKDENKGIFGLGQDFDLLVIVIIIIVILILVLALGRKKKESKEPEAEEPEVEFEEE